MLSEQGTIDFLNEIDSDFHNRIVLHDYYNLCNDFDLAGVNLNNRNLNLLQNQKIVSMSCHSLLEIEFIEYDLEYCFLSPVFDSISKRGYKSNFDLDVIADLIKRSKMKIVALGGITTSNAKQCLKAGFSGVAVLGCLWNDFLKCKTENAYNTFEELMDICKDH